MLTKKIDWLSPQPTTTPIESQPVKPQQAIGNAADASGENSQPPLAGLIQGGAGVQCDGAAVAEITKTFPNNNGFPNRENVVAGPGEPIPPRTRRTYNRAEQMLKLRKTAKLPGELERWQDEETGAAWICREVTKDDVGNVIEGGPIERITRLDVILNGERSVPM